jgi:hypothetical protein
MRPVTDTILVLGIALANKPTLKDDISKNLAVCTSYTVEQRWYRSSAADKFPQFNRLLGTDIGHYDYVIFTDDDIKFPDNFLDRYLAVVEHYGFALAQPARSKYSTGSHVFCKQNPALIARQTRFVECGPVFSMNRAAQLALLPFSTHFGMGAGRDFVWPHVLEAQGLTLGIVDSVPVDHAFRPDGESYPRGEANRAMRVYLDKTPHVAPKLAMTVVTEYPQTGWIV